VQVERNAKKKSIFYFKTCASRRQTSLLDLLKRSQVYQFLFLILLNFSAVRPIKIPSCNDNTGGSRNAAYLRHQATVRYFPEKPSQIMGFSLFFARCGEFVGRML
jgi:hypothetical protein